MTEPGLRISITLTCVIVGIVGLMHYIVRLSYLLGFNVSSSTLVSVLAMWVASLSNSQIHKFRSSAFHK